MEGAAVRVAELGADGVPLRGVAVRHVVGGDLAAGVERVEADVAGALPLGHVDLGGPPARGVQPERGPRALGGRGQELAAEVVAPAGGHREGLLGVHRPRQVVDRVLDAAVLGGRLALRRVRRQRQHAVGVHRDLGLVHAGAAVVVRPPRVVVVPVRVEVREGLRREHHCAFLASDEVGRRRGREREQHGKQGLGAHDGR